MNAVAKKLLGYLATSALGDLIAQLNDEALNFSWARLLARLVELRDRSAQ